MKTPLPKPRMVYHLASSRASHAAMLANAPRGFVVWARVEGAATSIVVLLRRVKTHELPTTKWVEFRAEPEGSMANGTPYTQAHGTLDMMIASDWPSYLKLVHRKKQAADTESDGHLACLYRCGPTGGFHPDQVWELRAGDVPSASRARAPATAAPAPLADDEETASPNGLSVPLAAATRPRFPTREARS
jgi:hypothetical protein